MAADDRVTDHFRESFPGLHGLLARRLRDAHRRVRLLAVPREERVRLTKRLLVICDVAKRDIHHANARLEAFLTELAAYYDTPSERNMAAGD
ncbi:hypothetical protein GCM10010106_47880 [Thermopolyspora flexuosa]|uniref:Uncharacterized protein n=1 Tax=Thermopolyspora flexuosa TaxID=103836 RepID=A0A543ITW0_9ACTN|nr:hypothetical protein [Thermopolyspora flexuosa]TQM74011.1 hypothetical protein FHX40_0672 [Thermopolyspora flexuosa]GGM93820.1 hypothetical protein GCM10010106_47880 [Thermopolyspora flexuosa]